MKTKDLVILITLSSLLLTSCVTIKNETNRSDMLADPTLVAPVFPVSIIPSTSITTTPALPSASTPSPTSAPQTIDLRWDTSPTARVIRYYSPYTTAGLAGAYNRNYYIPEVQVWGDGRIIWVEREGAARRVLEGRLTLEQMGTLMQRIVDSGFFDWKDQYYTLGGNSYPPMHLSVDLICQSKTVYEHGGAPDAYYDLEQFLSSGAGCAGSDYVPTLGYLTATPWPAEAYAAHWPDATAGITLDQVGDGLYVKGEALNFAWQAVNKNPTAPVYVESNGDIYAIMIQVPGVSFFDPPPTQPWSTPTPHSSTPAPAAHAGPTVTHQPTATPAAEGRCEAERDRISSEMTKAWQLTLMDVNIEGLEEALNIIAPSQ